PLRQIGQRGDPPRRQRRDRLEHDDRRGAGQSRREGGGACRRDPVYRYHRPRGGRGAPRPPRARRPDHPTRGRGVRPVGRRALVPSTRPATDADWDTEYLDLILAVLVVDDLDAAIAHIGRHGTGLAEAIVTNDLGHARRFTREVDAAAVLVNASTRLVDGAQF